MAKPAKITQQVYLSVILSDETEEFTRTIRIPLPKNNLSKLQVATALQPAFERYSTAQGTTTTFFLDLRYGEELTKVLRAKHVTSMSWTWAPD